MFTRPILDTFALFLVGVVVYELATGKLTDRGGGTILRSKRPIAYWINAIAGMIFGFFLLLMVIHDLYRWAAR